MRRRAVDGLRLKPNTKVGLYKAADNMPAGWLMWMLEQYGINHEVMKAQDFAGDLNAKYDVILLPSGIDQGAHVRRPQCQAQRSGRVGVGVRHRRRRLGEAEEVRRERRHAARDRQRRRNRARAARPADRTALPQGAPRFGGQGGATAAAGSAGNADAVLRDAFSSPARLMQTLRDRVADPQSLFYCPGSLLNNEFDPTNPIAWGMPASWPVFFDDDQAYRLRPGFGVDAKVVSRYPRENMLASGWLLGEEYLKDQANILSFRVGKGNVVTYGSQIDFRAQPRATFKLIFNGMFHGPSTPVTAAQMGRPSNAADEQRAAVTARQHPFGHGRLAYVQIPALDVNASAAFYKDIFGWRMRGGSSSQLSFTDATGDIIGAFVTGRAISRDPGVIFYLYVHGLDDTLATDGGGWQLGCQGAVPRGRRLGGDAAAIRPGT